jgi:hypothetical protein
MSRFPLVYRAGWKERGDWKSRFGKWWVWIGPYVIGYVRNF